MKTIAGYIATFILETFGAYGVCLVLSTTTPLYLGTCWYIETLFSDLFEMIHQMDEFVKNKSGVTSLKLRLIKVIEFHNRIIQYEPIVIRSS